MILRPGNYGFDSIRDWYKKLGYPFKEKGFQLNPYGIASTNKKSNEFDDVIGLIGFDLDRRPMLFEFLGTTNPGKFWLQNYENEKGAAILPPGFYEKIWKIGKHRGRYPALVQNRPITVCRDNDRDDEYEVEGMEKDTGVFGINCHHASDLGESKLVDKWSAGCQVLANIQEWNQFWNLIVQSSKIHGDIFDYALFLDGEKVV